MLPLFLRESRERESCDIYIYILFFFKLNKRKGYKGGSFPLLIQKKEEVNDLINEKGMGSLTVDPIQTKTTLK
jgi:hypothetical protein